MKSTKKRMLLSMLSVALCAVMLIGTTFAWFTDSVTSGKNSIKAGNLDVELYHSNASTTEEKVTSSTDSLFSVDKWEPGVIAYENFKVSNDGDLALKYSLAMNIADYNYVDGTSYNLTQVLKVAIIDGGFTGDRDAALALDFNSNLDEFAKKGELVANGDSDTFGVVIYWKPTDSDNDYNLNNGKTASASLNGVTADELFVDLGVNLVATQLSYESDTFDELYDANVALPINESAKGKAVDLASEIVLQSNDVKAVIPANALKAEDVDANDVIALNVENTDRELGSATYDIELVNVTDGNAPIEETNEIVTVTVNVGKNLRDVKVFHKTEPMTKAVAGPIVDQTYDYNPLTGILTIYTASFSPFTVKYATDTAPKFSVEDKTVAGAVDFYQFQATKPTKIADLLKYSKVSHTLDVAKKFVADKDEIDNIETSSFKDYNADFVVSFDKDVECGTAGFAGQYDNYSEDWIGFDVPAFIDGVKDGKLVAGTETRLLQNAGITKTYKEICLDVVDFTCGAADLTGDNAGTNLTVELRLYETVGGVETGAYVVAGTYTAQF